MGASSDRDKFTAVVVDDEPLARARVCSLLKEEPDVDVVAECRDGIEAIHALQQHRPDFAFLDIQMPEVNGFGVLQKLPEELWPVVIFVTAFDRHAVEAFEVHAVDYLLKPFKPARFRQAVERARAIRLSKTGSDLQVRLRTFLEGQKSTNHLTRITVKEGGRTQFVRVSDIDWIEAAGNYLVLHLGKESHIIRETLSGLEAKLPPREFVRVSRSALANTSRIKELQPMAAGDTLLLLRDGTKLSVTRPVRELEEAIRFS